MNEPVPTAWTRRRFLRQTGCGVAAAAGGVLSGGRPAAAEPADETGIWERIEAHRPSRLAALPADFRARVGAAHVAGKYCLTDEPFLIEGARRLLALGTRLGKFWFTPANPAGSYPFHSHWPACRNFVELAKTPGFRQLFELPFETFFLEAHTPVEEGWRRPGRDASFYQAVTEEFRSLTAHLYEVFRERPVTVVLQHWEGDWLLRGAGKRWDPPPVDWQARCQAMAAWLRARQAGVSAGRRETGARARCVVAHAAEVNRVADAWRGIPTMTEHVLPEVEVDLVSYSAYDGLASPRRLWRCLETIRKHARTGGLFGPGAVSMGEFGIPENEQPERIAERIDRWLGVALAAGVRQAVYWQLYCNELARGGPGKPAVPVKDPAKLRGFWLVRPDGSLGAAGRFLREQWRRAGG